MSELRATKVSTPLSENVQIGHMLCDHHFPELNPLGHGVQQSSTGCYWNPLPLLHDDITELVDVRDPALLHLLFEDAPQILNMA